VTKQPGIKLIAEAVTAPWLRWQVSGPSLFDDQPNRGDKH